MGAKPKKTPPGHAPKAEPTAVNTNYSTTVPETGTIYAGNYLQYSVTYRVNDVGRKIIITPPELYGVVINP